MRAAPHLHVVGLVEDKDGVLPAQHAQAAPHPRVHLPDTHLSAETRVRLRVRLTRLRVTAF